MSEKVRAAITGVAGYVPDYILNNAELEHMVDTNDEWIVTRTGVKERRILKGENKGTSVMAIKAVEELLRKTKTDPLDINIIICATVTPDMLFPATANIISNGVGANNAWGYDLSAACSGFIFALTTASKFIESGAAKKVIVIGADKMSSIVDYSDRTTCVLFGDGAAAVLLEPDAEGFGIRDTIMHADGSGKPFLHQKAGGSAMPPTKDTVENKLHYIYQEGQAVFKFAVTNMADVAAEIVERNNLAPDDIAWLVPHQANLRILQATARRIGIDDSKVMVNIDRYGNTTNATIPLCLWEWENKLKKGDNIILAAFGGGFTWGSIYIKWAYNS